MSKYGKFFGSWEEPLLPFLESEHWTKIGDEIKEMQKAGKKILPTFLDIFKPFQLCPFDDLKVVILTANPFNDGEYNGIPFGSYPSELIKPNTKPKSGDSRPLAVLDKVLTAVKKDFPETSLKPSDLSLERWCKQGVLMLNCNLTRAEGDKLPHLNLWKPFIEYLMGVLKRQKCGIIYVLSGSIGEVWRKHINLMQNDIIPVEHPLMAVKEARDWEHKNMFVYINRVSTLINDKKIKW